ncbi:oxidoreductase [Curvibacter sp. APW13]|uniref:oxidoreductase n=1 Tax=Curvibacter sp. APW13 TaxID=3077236 RepID=UPI0028DE5B4D|nr:oxidoreductase [Curvibacter sp. APW13]MDT8991674.1 oxidoreductase [Curvibacter sp. APW13]
MHRFESSRIRVALVGYGNAGRIFHAPLISAVPGLHLHTVVSSKAPLVLGDWPEVRVCSTLQEALSDPSLDLVVVATGNDSHFSVAQAALAAGKHVVVDKPCTVTLQETQTLLQLASAKGLLLTVFQNRRWDADFLGLQQVLAQGSLGRIAHFESHFDRYRPSVPDRWREKDMPGSGLWFDLGSHLVDQALTLFGAPADILLDLGTQRDGAEVNDYFHAVLRYPHLQDLRVVLHGSTLVAGLGPRFAVHGTHGSWVKFGLDTQEDTLKSGERPVWGDPAWGADPTPARITTAAADGLATQEIALPHGNYPQFYAAVAQALRSGGEVPVSPDQVQAAMQLLTLGGESARSGRFVPVPPLPVI